MIIYSFTISSDVSLQSCASSVGRLWWQVVVIITLETVSMPGVYTATPVVSGNLCHIDYVIILVYDLSLIWGTVLTKLQ